MKPIRNIFWISSEWFEKILSILLHLNPILRAPLVEVSNSNPIETYQSYSKPF